jgi:hypothetical protein
VKTFSTATQEALESGEAIVTAAIKVVTPGETWRVWGGYGDLAIAGEADPFTGIGDRALVTASGGELGSAANALTIDLNGVEPENLRLLGLSGLRRAPVVVWRLIFDVTGANMLAAHVFTRGRLDVAPVTGTPGGEKSIRFDIEGAARSLGRRMGRMRTDADQRLIRSDDPGFELVSIAGEVKLYWGGKTPERAGSALPGSSFLGHLGQIMGLPQGGVL